MRLYVGSVRPTPNRSVAKRPAGYHLLWIFLKRAKVLEDKQSHERPAADLRKLGTTVLYQPVGAYEAANDHEAGQNDYQSVFCKKG